MLYMKEDALVDTAWVAEHLGDAQVRIVDGSWHLPPTGRNGHDEYLVAHIPGAVYFDIDTISDPDSTLPHMLPTAEAFAAAVGEMGISSDHRVVVYDSVGLFSAPRVWWMFRAFGHDNVAVMTGGFRAWQNQGRPATDQVPAPPAATFGARLNGEYRRSGTESSSGRLVVPARLRTTCARAGPVDRRPRKPPRGTPKARGRGAPRDAGSGRGRSGRDDRAHWSSASGKDRSRSYRVSNLQENSRAHQSNQPCNQLSRIHRGASAGRPDTATGPQERDAR